MTTQTASLIGPRASQAAASTIAGWRLSFAAGFVPLLAGLTTLLTNWVNVARGDSPWWTGAGSLGFSHRSLDTAGADAAAYRTVFAVATAAP